MEIATNMALCQFSKGFTFRETLCNFMGIKPGQHLVRKSLERSIERVKKANKTASKGSKQRRKRIKYAKILTEKAKTKKEGDTYHAGFFD